jgi:endonuclease/exonuclease/phosphatase (EEP) superfamily protein YafD
MTINAENLMLVGGAGAFLMTLYWVRVRELRERSAIAWLLVATLLLLVGLFPEVIERAAERARLSYPAAVLFVALTIIYLNSFFVSVSLTKQYRWNVRLTQQLALLEERVRRLEEGMRDEG